MDTAKSDEGFESKNLQFRIKMNEYRNRIKRIEEPYQPDAGNLWKGGLIKDKSLEIPSSDCSFSWGS